MENKQTAVEWLFKLSKERELDKFDLEQAKQMEKQQIMKAVYDSIRTNFDPNWGRAEQYYNETYESNL